MTQPTPGTDMQKRPYTYTFCLEHDTQGPYKVCKPGADLLHDAKGVSSVNYRTEIWLLSNYGRHRNLWLVTTACTVYWHVVTVVITVARK